MTEKVAKSKKRRAILPLSTRQTLFCVAATVALALTYMHSDVATASMAKAIDICIYSLIPSLFPFMVLSELLVSFGATSLIAKLAGRAFRFLFGISPAGAGAFIPGVLCGFPIGTRIALSLFERGEIDRRSLSHLLCFCNCPSPAFLIGAVGIGVFGSKNLDSFSFFASLSQVSFSVSSFVCALGVVQNIRQDLRRPCKTEAFAKLLSVPSKAVPTLCFRSALSLYSSPPSAPPFRSILPLCRCPIQQLLLFAAYLNLPAECFLFRLPMRQLLFLPPQLSAGQGFLYIFSLSASAPKPRSTFFPIFSRKFFVLCSTYASFLFFCSSSPATSAAIPPHFFPYPTRRIC